LFGWPFAMAFFVSSILMGLLGGMLAEFFEAHGWLANQARFIMQAANDSAGVGNQKLVQVAGDTRCAGEVECLPVGQIPPVRAIRETRPVLVANPALAHETFCGPAIATIPESDCVPGPVAALPGTCTFGSSGPESRLSIATVPEQHSTNKNCSSNPGTRPVTARQWVIEIYRTGKQLLVMFVGFAFLGYVLNGLIPPAWVAAIFGTGNAYSVPLAATLGLPFYLNTEGSLPLVRALIDGGMSQGAALAFLISGAGTSVGAIAGALTIARWRVVTLVIGTLWVGAMVMGYAYDLLLAAHLFS
jgi:uncharacterized membrane protein YraQ (UPF0718 family)